MNIVRQILIVTLKIYLVTAGGSLVAPSRLLVTRIGPCYGISRALTITEMSITRKHLDFTLSGRLNISVDVANGWSIKATMQKCHDIRDLDTCDHYKSLTVVKSGCDGEDEDDQKLQDSFFPYVTPRLSCPLQAGVYQISNYPLLTEEIDLSAAESKISTSVFGYTYRLDGFDEDYQKILCVDAFLQLIYVREHDWIGKQNVKPVRGPATNHTSKDAVDNQQSDYIDTDVKHDDNTKKTSDSIKNVKQDDHVHGKHENNDEDVKRDDAEDERHDDDTQDVKN